MNFVHCFAIVCIFLLSANSILATKRFIFRLDDVQDFYHSAEQVYLMNYFMNNNIGVSAGIISDYFDAQDSVLYAVLQRCAAMSKDKCALFNHGKDASYIFADAPSVASAKTQIQACDSKIKQYFNNYQVEMFIPHQNSWGQNLLTALQQLGYLGVSASTDSYSGMDWDLTTDPIQMPQQTQTGDYQDDGSWAAHPINQIVSECQAASSEGQDCVIMVHPEEFANGAFTLTMLTQLINQLKAAGFTSTNFHTIINEVRGGVVSTNAPTRSPTRNPTRSPTTAPTTKAPVQSPTTAPTIGSQTSAPTTGIVATSIPTRSPTRAPSQAIVTSSPTVAVTTASTTSQPGKRFIFRLDDIQDYYHSAEQVYLLNYFMDNNIGVTAGIIGDYFSGEDAAVYAVLQRCAAMSKDKCALFNHGRDASYIFGNAPSVASAVSQIQACDSKIKQYFNNYQVEMFIPHQNSWGQNLLAALRQLGYLGVSASTQSYSGMEWDLTTNPIQMPQQTQTGDYQDDGSWTAHSIDQIVSECLSASSEGQDCVIMVHPEEFANGAFTLTMLTQLINQLKAAGFTSTNFHTIINEVRGGDVSTNAPTRSPTRNPTRSPTTAPTTKAPVHSPTQSPTNVPTTATTTVSPSALPTTIAPTATKTNSPTSLPTIAPSGAQTKAPATSFPTTAVTSSPTVGQTYAPTTVPSAAKTSSPTQVVSTSSPSKSPTQTSSTPTKSPATLPTKRPSRAPTASPTRRTSSVTYHSIFLHWRHSIDCLF